MNQTTSPTIKSRSPAGRGIPPEIREKLQQFKTTKALVISGADKETIESALLLALNHVRSAINLADIQVATGKAQRAATLLKRACQTVREGGMP